MNIAQFIFACYLLLCLSAVAEAQKAKAPKPQKQNVPAATEREVREFYDSSPKTCAYIGGEQSQTVTTRAASSSSATVVRLCNRLRRPKSATKANGRGLNHSSGKISR